MDVRGKMSLSGELKKSLQISGIFVRTFGKACTSYAAYTVLMPSELWVTWHVSEDYPTTNFALK
jgi:hypothetical protein